MAHYGIASMAPQERDAMRDLILSRGPWTSEEQLAILDYCQSDVDALTLLFEKMAPLIDWLLCVLPKSPDGQPGRRRPNPYL